MRPAACVIVSLLGGMLLGLITADVSSGELSGGDATRTPHVEAASQGVFILKIHEGWLSPRAQDASLKAIFQALGRQVSTEVMARIPEEERITIGFDQLSLAEALKRFRPYVNYLALEDAAKTPGTVQKLIVVSKRAAGAPARPTTRDGDALAPSEHRQSEPPTPAAPARPKPFTFEFDPTTVGKRGR
jgi:hypothetical protein